MWRTMFLVVAVGLAYPPRADGQANPLCMCFADANVDGVVEPLDTGYVAARLGSVPAEDEECAAADANGDGLVDPLNAGDVLARFGTCLESSEPAFGGVAEAPGRILSGLAADWRL